MSRSNVMTIDLFFPFILLNAFLVMMWTRISVIMIRIRPENPTYKENEDLICIKFLYVSVKMMIYCRVGIQPKYRHAPATVLRPDCPAVLTINKQPVLQIPRVSDPDLCPSIKNMKKKTKTNIVSARVYKVFFINLNVNQSKTFEYWLSQHLG